LHTIRSREGKIEIGTGMDSVDKRDWVDEEEDDMEKKAESMTQRVDSANSG